MNGAKDFVQDFVVQPFLDKIPDVTYHKFENSSHTPWFEQKHSFMATVREFLS